MWKDTDVSEGLASSMLRVS